MCEMWKSLNLTDYPIKVETRVIKENEIRTRAVTSGMVVEKAKSNCTMRTFINDASKIWNLIPDNIKNSTSYSNVKKNAFGIRVLTVHMM